jgi:acyl-CoA reductase-like NAD-dependent aldehyde dehydrogenase
MALAIDVEDRSLPAFAEGAPKRLLIGGQWVEAAGGQTFDTTNPATGKKIASVAAGGAADVDAAVLAARRAFDDGDWPHLAPSQRARLLFAVADLLETHAPELSELDSLESGAPQSVMMPFVVGAAEAFRYYAGWPTKLPGSLNPTGPEIHSYTMREPMGVCAGIIPWNGPVVMAAWKAAPALACGNTMILKPAEQTSLSAVRLGELCLEAGIPDGVFNVITGFGETAGAAIAAHPGIDKVSFTGSTETGKAVLAASVDNLKRVTLELGGKSPHIVFADADVATAAATAAAGFCTLSGQVCFAGTRILVQQEIYDEFVAELSARVADYRLGDPFAEGTTMGPLVSAEQYQRVAGYIALGLEEGGRLAVGGEAPGGPGYFVEPTIFEDVANDFRLAREEIFGPVAAVMPFEGEDEAIRLANDTRYGLAAAVATRDISRAHKMARAIKAGVIWVNTYGELDPSFSFGGFKESGFGRELGPESLDAYTQTKSVLVRL